MVAIDYQEEGSCLAIAASSDLEPKMEHFSLVLSDSEMEGLNLAIQRLSPSNHLSHNGIAHGQLTSITAYRQVRNVTACFCTYPLFFAIRCTI